MLGVSGGRHRADRCLLEAHAVRTLRLNACIVAHSAADISRIQSDVTISSVLWYCGLVAMERPSTDG